MNQFLTGYLERFSKWVVVADDGAEGLTCNISGYCDGDGEEAIDDVQPLFLSRPVRRQGEIDFIRENRHKIRKILRVDEYPGGRCKVHRWSGEC